MIYGREFPTWQRTISLSKKSVKLCVLCVLFSKVNWSTILFIIIVDVSNFKSTEMQFRWEINAKITIGLTNSIQLLISYKYDKFQDVKLN